MLIAVKKKKSANLTNHCASILIRFAHISKNSIVWLPDLGVNSVAEESSEEVADEVREISEDFPWASVSESFWQDL